MSNCAISTGELAPLASVVAATTWLKKLDVSCNVINDAGMSRLIGESLRLVSCSLLQLAVCLQVSFRLQQLPADLKNGSCVLMSAVASCTCFQS
ncbi:MAG: hypothetical protein HC767_02495 [Akkermansiaceae bacterium]|nr:hypothetical protein [Akkermansiaceae bacterium]